MEKAKAIWTLYTEQHEKKGAKKTERKNVFPQGPWGRNVVLLSFYFVSFFHAVPYVMSIWLLHFLLLPMTNNLHLRTYVQPSCLSSRISVLPSVTLISLYHPFPHLFLASLHFLTSLLTFVFSAYPLYIACAFSVLLCLLPDEVLRAKRCPIFVFFSFLFFPCCRLCNVNMSFAFSTFVNV